MLIRVLFTLLLTFFSPKTEPVKNLEAVSFYQNGSKLTLGIQADFEKQSGKLLSNGLEITTNESLNFIVCWINDVTEENDHQTWFGADISYNIE